MIVVQGFALYGPLAASTRYRLEQYAPGLRSQGIDLRMAYLLDDQYLVRTFRGQKASILGLLRSGVSRLSDLARVRSSDAAIVHCELLPLLPGWLERALLQRPYLYDFDDAFYLRYQKGRMGALKPLLGKKFDQVIKGAAAVTAGNDELARYACQFNSMTEVLPTVVDTDRYIPDVTKKTATFTVGWIGSPSTSPYLQEIVGPLTRLAQEGPVRLIVIGGAPPAIAGVDVLALPWSEKTEVELINSFDVGVMPIPDDEWARGKCAFKLIQYMACAVPVVASAVGANKAVVTSECGHLAQTEDEWVAALRTLRDSSNLRKRMGEAGRLRVAEHYSLQIALPQMAAAIRRIAGK